MIRVLEGAGKRFLLLFVAFLLVGGGCPVQAAAGLTQDSAAVIALPGEEDASAGDNDTEEQPPTETEPSENPSGEGESSGGEENHNDEQTPGEGEQGSGTGGEETTGGDTPSGDTPPGEDDNPVSDDPGGENTPKEEKTDEKEPDAKVTIPATDLDIGDVTPIIKGNSQILSVTTIPMNATDSITYTSLTPQIASVNALGRVKGLAYGTATIQIQAGDVIRTVKVEITREETPEVETEVDATAIDVTYEETMHPGGTQVLSTSVLPANATDTVSYSSGNTAVATVNDFGRVEAISVGDAVITAKAGRAKKAITIHVVDKITATDIDFEVADSQLRLGSSITIGATVLPTDAEDQKIKYTSSDPSVLTVNALGRVTGRALGTATITMEAGAVQKSIELTVVEELVVSNIEVSDFNEKMKVDSTQNLNTSVFPTDAKDQKITYSSSKPAVASVAENGTITAKGKGTTTIGLKAGKAYKELSLTVYVATDVIAVPENYVILHPGETYRILAEVRPKNADQRVLYESTNKAVATVSGGGVITAVASGRASIVLKNDDAMTAVTVIVNEGTPESAAGDYVQSSETQREMNGGNLESLIRNAEDHATVSVSGSEAPLLTEKVLLALYETKATLNIRYDDSYSMTIRGGEIKNVHNVLSTDIGLHESGEGIWFYVNESQNMPGSVSIRLLNLNDEYKYVYLENDKGEYKKLNLSKDNTVEIGISGKYLLTKQKISNNRWMMPTMMLGGGLILAGALAYCAAKKKYWLW